MTYIAPYYSNLQPKDNNALVWLDHTCTYARAFPRVPYTDARAFPRVP